MKVKTQAYTRMSLTCGNALTPKKQPRKPHEAFSLPPEILYWCGQKDMNKTVSLKLIVNKYLESYSFPHAQKERDSDTRRPEKACETLKCFLSNKWHPSLTGFPCHRNRPRSIASAFRTSFIAPITNICTRKSQAINRKFDDWSTGTSTNSTFDQTYEGNNHNQTKLTVKDTKRNCSFQNEWPRTWLRWGACCKDGLSLLRCRLELALSGGPLAPPMKMSALQFRTQNPTNIECHHYYSAAQCCTSWVWANTSLNSCQEEICINLGFMSESYRQDCLMYRIEEPFLPIMRPIFPYGTSTTASTSSCGTSSTAKLSGRNENPPEMWVSCVQEG